LATVAALTVGGCVVTYEPGPPGICKILKIPVDPNLRLVTAYFTTRNTQEILQIPNFDRQINKWGDITLHTILQDPNVETLLTASREFALRIGLMTEKVETTIKLMEHAGAVAATQNMIGEAAHAIAYKDDLSLIVENLKKNIKPKRILVSEIGGTPKILTPLLETATLKH
jgi:pantoate kinase